MAAKNSEQLRKLIQGVIDVVLASVDHLEETASSKKSSKRNKV